MKRIFFVEDDLSLIGGLSFALRKQGYEIDIARTSMEAESLWQNGIYDLVILDVSLPDGSGYDLCRKIRETSRVPVMFLTAADEETDIIMGLDIGGDDYITKPFGMMEFIARVKAVLRRISLHGDDRELSCEELRIFPGRHQVYCDDQPVELTRKEFELLLYLMENRGIVMTRDQILCHIWGYDFDGETRTVEVHVRTLRQKLGDAGRLIETVRGVGYRMADKGGSQG